MESTGKLMFLTTDPYIVLNSDLHYHDRSKQKLITIVLNQGGFRSLTFVRNEGSTKPIVCRLS